MQTALTPHCASNSRGCVSFVHIYTCIPGDACFRYGRIDGSNTGQGSMVDWGPDDWGIDIDWTEMEQQGAKRHKSCDTRCPEPLAAVQVVRLPWVDDKPPVPWSCDANREPSLADGDELWSTQIVEPKQQGIQAAEGRLPLRARHPNLALRQRFLIKPALGKAASAADLPHSKVLGQSPDAHQQSPASVSAHVALVDGNSQAIYDSAPWQQAGAGVQGERPPSAPSALPSSSRAASPAGIAGIEHLCTVPTLKHVSPSAQALNGRAAAVASADQGRILAGQTPPAGNAGPRLSAQQARLAPSFSPAPVVDLTACDSYQPVYQHGETLQSAANLARGGAVSGQRGMQAGGMQLQGAEQQSTSSNSVRLPALLPFQAAAQQSSSSHQPASSICPGVPVTLPHHRAAHPLESGAGRQAHLAQGVLPQQAAAQQHGSKPQSASAPSAPMASHGTGVFSNTKSNDSDDDDFMPSKLLADISKAASAPSSRALQHSSDPAAGPQGCASCT